MNKRTIIANAKDNVAETGAEVTRVALLARFRPITAAAIVVFERVQDNRRQ